MIYVDTNKKIELRQLAKLPEGQFFLLEKNLNGTIFIKVRNNYSEYCDYNEMTVVCLRFSAGNNLVIAEDYKSTLKVIPIFCDVKIDNIRDNCVYQNSLAASEKVDEEDNFIEPNDHWDSREN